MRTIDLIGAEDEEEQSPVVAHRKSCDSTAWSAVGQVGVVVALRVVAGFECCNVVAKVFLERRRWTKD